MKQIILVVVLLLLGSTCANAGGACIACSCNCLSVNPKLQCISDCTLRASLLNRVSATDLHEKYGFSKELASAMRRAFDKNTNRDSGKRNVEAAFYRQYLKVIFKGKIWKEFKDRFDP